MKPILKYTSKIFFYLGLIIILGFLSLGIFPKEAYATICDCDCHITYCWLCDPPGEVSFCIWDECGECPCPPGTGGGSCINCSSCGGGGGCFTGETKISTVGGDPSTGSGQGKEIKDIKEGDVVKSFSSETGKIRKSTVSAIHKREVEGYYVLKTDSGKEVKVTGEHPVLAVKNQENNQISNNQITKSISNDKFQIIQIIKNKIEEIWESFRNL